MSQTATGLLALADHPLNSLR